MSKFTPGPWRWVRNKLVSDAGGVVIDYDSYEGMWFSFAGKWDDQRKCWPEELANRALVAAAPELHDALQLMRDAWDMPENTKVQRERRSAAWQAMTNALAKVEA